MAAKAQGGKSRCAACRIHDGRKEPSFEQSGQERRHLGRDPHGGAGRGQTVRRAAAGQGRHFLFRIHGLGQERQGRVGHGRGPQDQLDVDRQEEIHDLQPGRHLDGRRSPEIRRQGRQQAGRGAVVPVADLHLLVPDALADRRVDLLHAPDARRRPGWRVLVRQEQGADAGRGEQHRSRSPTSPAATRRRRKSPNWSSSCATRPSSRNWAAAFRAAC